MVEGIPLERESIVVPCKEGTVSGAGAKMTLLVLV
jgi:hypothetical protein